MTHPERIVGLVGDWENFNRSRQKHEAEQPAKHANKEGENVIPKILYAALN